MGEFKLGEGKQSWTRSGGIRGAYLHLAAGSLAVGISMLLFIAGETWRKRLSEGSYTPHSYKLGQGLRTYDLQSSAWPTQGWKETVHLCHHNNSYGNTSKPMSIPRHAINGQICGWCRWYQFMPLNCSKCFLGLWPPASSGKHFWGFMDQNLYAMGIGILAV